MKFHSSVFTGLLSIVNAILEISIRIAKLTPVSFSMSEHPNYGTCKCTAVTLNKWKITLRFNLSGRLGFSWENWFTNHDKIVISFNYSKLVYLKSPQSTVRIRRTCTTVLKNFTACTIIVIIIGWVHDRKILLYRKCNKRFAIKRFLKITDAHELIQVEWY